MDVLCQHNARHFNMLNAFRFPIFFMEDHVIFKGKFSWTLHLFKNLNQPANPRNNVPTNVPIFMNPRKLGPTKINDFTVLHFFKQFLMMYTTFKPFSPATSYVLCVFWVYPSRSVFISHWNYLPERACKFGNDKNTQGARYCEYVLYGSSKTFCRHRYR